ncbi:hypothetical protein G5I_07033 [Acromyrmex echinatior]|uniref:Uncharacterized protein n=1 Tax=Acromyrmex echinatior TaxID=103372 RepID=F4WMP9_ACREC|nr:hypothetical protein G5I_07033 [Acromyrmex echinatior]
MQTRPESTFRTELDWNKKDKKCINEILNGDAYVFAKIVKKIEMDGRFSSVDTLKKGTQSCRSCHVLTKIYKTCEQPPRRAKQRNHIDPEHIRATADGAQLFHNNNARHSYTRFRSVDSSFRTIDPHYMPAAGRGASLYSAIRPFAVNTHASYLDPTATNSHEIWIDLC